MTYKELEHAVRHFFEECKKRDIEDPSSIDFKYMFEAGLDYYETLDKIDEFLNTIRPPPPEPIEVGIDELLSKAAELGLKIREEDLAKIENVKRIEEALERTKRIAEKYKRELEIERTRREALERERAAPEAVPAPPPKPPEVKPPPVKVLPEVPEKCPIDGSPISEVTRVPIGPVPIRLTAEEEYMRARVGLPIPERQIVWLDVPPTMKLYHCSQDHLFERYPATGRLIQRTPEYVYRKILRETAALRRVVYPEVAAPPAPAPVYYYPPPPPRPMKLQDVFWDWVERVKGLTREQFMALSWEEKERIRKEWGEWVRRTGAG
jgi:hypothetical protein